MCHLLISHNTDLSALVKAGYRISIVGGYLVVEDIPYIAKDGHIGSGAIVSTLELHDQDTVSPLTQHTVWWTGRMPHRVDGTSMERELCCSIWPDGFNLGNGLTAYARWSMKLRHQGSHRAYRDHKDKIDTYVSEVGGEADAQLPGALAMAKRGTSATLELNSRFKYMDMNTFRSGTAGIEQSIKDEIVAVIGIGGSGSYLVDILAKTNIKELHLYDHDTLSYHNAFRIAGAASGSELSGTIKKVQWHKKQYVPVREDGIYAHDQDINENTIAGLRHCTMVFIAVDRLDVRRQIQTQLSSWSIPHIAVGLGVDIEGEHNNQLAGMVKVEVLHTPRSGGGVPVDQEELIGQAEADDMYGNIQTSELNMLSAALAIVEWKAMRGFYRSDRPSDIDSMVYVISTGRLFTQRMRES